MSLIAQPHKIRKGMTDCFNAFMVDGAEISAPNDIPICYSTMQIPPKKIITYEEAQHSTDYDATVVFFKDDEKFDGVLKGIWSKPQHCLNIVSKFSGVATPDFGTNQDFPYPLLIFNTYRMRSFGFWLIKNGVNVVNTVRWGNQDTWTYCFDGIPKKSMVIVSTHGCIKNNSDKTRFKQGLAELVKRISPPTILVYGSAPDDIFHIHKAAGINIIQYPARGYYHV